MNLDRDLTPPQQLTQNGSHLHVKLVEDNIGKTHMKCGFIAQSLKEKTDNIKIKNFCFVKDSIKRKRR
jgi:hypothetical protein